MRKSPILSTVMQKLAVGHDTEFRPPPPPCKGSISFPCDQPDAISAAGEATTVDGNSATIADAAADNSTTAAHRRTAVSFGIAPPRGWEPR